MKRPRRRVSAGTLLMVAAAVAAALLCGCSAEHYRRSADRNAYAIVAEKSAEVPLMQPNFALPPTSEALPSPAAEATQPPVTLAQAVSLAMLRNRDYVSRTEDVYLSALGLTLERHQWGPTFFGVISAMWRHSSPENERTVSANSSLGIRQLLRTGGEASLSLASNLFRFLSGDPRQTASSALNFALRQHLWRGAGEAVATESLTQAERDVVYSLRSFVRFRQDFVVSVASAYYDVLQQKDVVDNEWRNVQTLTDARERAEMLAQAGRLPEFQVAQAQQDELSARDRWVRARQNYEGAIDDFKIRLAIPLDAPLALDETELSKLRGEPLAEVAYTRERAAELAMRLRLDLATVADGVEDARRKVVVAKDNLAPGVDLLLNASIGTLPANSLVKFREDNSSYGYGVDVDLPLDRLAQRNSYRSALIALDRRVRALDLQRDQVKRQIADAWRGVIEARESYAIQLQSVTLAERRVDSTSMFLEAGRATMRDVLDAQSSLLNARNALTGALVRYKIGVLQLWRDMGVLDFKDDQFMEVIPDVANARVP